MTKNENLRHELKQFYCSEAFYKNPLFPKYIYTEGVKYLAEQAGAYWLIDYIYSNQQDSKIATAHFQAWKLKQKGSSAATITVDDGNKNILESFELEFTDFPFDILYPKQEAFQLWFIDGVLMLPSEY